MPATLNFNVPENHFFRIDYCSASLLRHLLEALQAPPEDQFLA
jgi:hypothetical protein